MLAALLMLVAAGASLGAPEDSRKVVKASDILAAIERGEPVDYDGVIVEGDLDLSGLELPTEHVERTQYEIRWRGLTEEAKLIESPINITNSEIRGDVTFSNSIFQEQVKFENTNFSGYADFSDAVFDKEANFNNVQFN